MKQLSLDDHLVRGDHHVEAAGLEQLLLLALLRDDSNTRQQLLCGAAAAPPCCWWQLGRGTRARTLTRSSWLPWNLATRMTGQKRRNSLHQLPMVDLGTMTMCGPLMPRYSYR